MSTNTYPLFFNSQYLPSANGVIYTAPVSPTTIVVQELQLKISNTTAATHAVTLYAVPSGESAAVDKAIAVEMSVPPYDYILLPVPRIAAGATIEGFTDTAEVLTVQPVGGKLHTP